MTILAKIRAAGGRAFIGDNGRPKIRRVPRSVMQSLKDSGDQLLEELRQCELFGIDPRGEWNGSPEAVAIERLWNEAHRCTPVAPRDVLTLKRLLWEIEDAGASGWAAYDAMVAQSREPAQTLIASISEAVRLGMEDLTLYSAAKRILVEEPRQRAIEEVFA